MASDIVTGAQGGLQKNNVGTGETSFVVTTWKGRYIKISAQGARVFYVFAPTAITIAPDTETLDAAAPLATAPDVLEDGASVQELVPAAATETGAMFLRVRTETGTAAVRVRNAE